MTRRTRDLDFFGLTTEAVDRLIPAVDRALRAAGMGVRHVRENPGYARLVVEGVDDRTEVDLAADARLFPVDTRQGVPTLNGEELAVDKVLAVFGRAEARDFVDLSAARSGSGRPPSRGGASQDVWVCGCSSPWRRTTRSSWMRN